MISVDAALDALFRICQPLPVEYVSLRNSAFRTLNGKVAAYRDQPPFSASSMDGYAIPGTDIPTTGTKWTVIGESAAGHGYSYGVNAGECVRIFTGAPLPHGTNRVVIQEDVDRLGDTITLRPDADQSAYVRHAGADFKFGDEVTGPRIVTPALLSLFAAMNAKDIPVTRQPRVAIIGTGDELVQPGETPNPDQIIASNIHGLAAMIEREGCIARVLPIARDRLESLETVFDLAKGCDLVLTIGGASVGDHDLVGKAAKDRGLNQTFYKVSMRPGKPLMAGTLSGVPMIGLPGNPVSALVCGTVFVIPVLRKMLGFPAAPIPRLSAPLATSIGANGPREHYMRAVLADGEITVLERQDSALLSVLSEANALVIRPSNAPPMDAGESVEYLQI